MRKHFFLISFFLFFSCFLKAENQQGITEFFIQKRSFTVEEFPFSQGTVQFNLTLKVPVNELKQHTLLKLKSSEKEYFALVLHKGKLLIKLFSEKGKNEESIDLTFLEIGRSYKFSFTWGQFEDTGRVKLYVDSMLKAQKKYTPFTAEKNLFLTINEAAASTNDAFAPVIDNFVIFPYALPQSLIRKDMESSSLKDTFKNQFGFLLQQNSDSNLQIKAVKAIENKTYTDYLSEQLRIGKINKYADEIDFKCYFDVPMAEENAAEKVRDGNDNTSAGWRQRKVALICEFDHSYDVEEIEIVTRKHTKWYILKELHISVDEGTGNFSPPYIIKTYGVIPTNETALVDDSCRTYFYTQKLNKQINRVKISFVGRAHMNVNEVRFRGKESK